MKRKTRTTRSRTTPRTSSNSDPVRIPFVEHLIELRRRFFYVALSVVIWGGVAYAVEHQIINALLAPAHGEKFIYTSVGGGINFLFQVCIYVGIVFSLPVIIYQTLRYVQPLIGKHASRLILTASAISGVLALGGMAFGYFLGLPAALTFLLHQFHTQNISALITIQSYLSFVIVYLVGSSLIFQVPLVIYLINRLKPLKLRTLWKYERWVIVVSLVAAAFINPTPRFYDLAIIAVPMILSYQLGILIVWLTNRRRKPSQLEILRQKDAKLQAERTARLQTVEYVWHQAEMAASLAPTPTMAPKPAAPSRAPTPKPASISTPPTTQSAARATHATTPSARSQKYVNDFVNYRQQSRPRYYVDR
jgi:sec-independent protein translocase protein TatC